MGSRRGLPTADLRTSLTCPTADCLKIHLQFGSRDAGGHSPSGWRSAQPPCREPRRS